MGVSEQITENLKAFAQREQQGAVPTGSVDYADLSPAAIAALNGTYAGLDNLYGFTSAALPNWHKAVAKVRAGTDDAKVLCIGDSTVQGSGDSTVATIPATKAWPAGLASMLSSYLVPAAHGLAIPPQTAAGAADTRWTYGTGWAKNSSSQGWYGTGVKGTNPTSGNLTWTDSRVTWDKIDVYYIQGTAGTITCTATGGTSVVQTTTGGAAIQKITCTAASASSSNTLTVVQSVGDVVIVGVDPWLSTTTKVRVGNAGVPQATSSGWALVGGYSSRAAILAYAPDLTIIGLGTNDVLTGIANATTLANLQTVITDAAVSGDVIVLTPFPINSATQAAGAASLATLVPTLFGGLTVPIADLTTRSVSYAAYNAAGFMGDDRHGNDQGYQDVAAFLFKGLSRAA